MAAATCGLGLSGSSSGSGGGGGGSAALKAPHKDKKKAAKDSTTTSRRRQAALLFLNNISLDGRPLYRGNNDHTEPPTTSSTTTATTSTSTPELLLHHRGSALPLPQVTAAAAGGVVTAGSSAALPSPPPAPPPPPPAPPQTTTTTTTTTSTSSSSSSSAVVLSPVALRPSSVVIMSPPVAGHRWSVVGLRGNDSEVFLEDAMLPPDSPLSPGGPLLAGGPLARSPSVFSPLPGGVTSASAASMPQRSRNVSGSPGPKAAKKVHFIKTMKQYDTRGCRIMLICAKRSLCAAFSVMPYGQSSVSLSDVRMDTQRQRLSSVVTPDLLPALEGVELGAYNGKTVSYAPFLYPTNALVRGRSNSALDACPAHTPQPRYRANNGQRGGGGSFTPAARINSSNVMQEQSIEDAADYDPNLLSDPQWPCGRHKRVLIFASYVTTVIEYVKPSDLKKSMNQTFREKFPHIKLTLSKIRSLKREMRALSEEGGLQPVTIAMAFVYFEKLVLQGRLNKNNRKLVCAACVLLAAKISSDLRKNEVKQLIDRLEERFRINRRELIPLEFSVLVALEMGLYLPESMVMPHYRRLVLQG